MDGISVIICCYNSAERLAETISYLTKQELVQLQKYEIIIIDNKSTDDTFLKAKELEKKYDQTTIKLFKENTPGLSYARHCGVLKSAYDYMIFCDDDNLLFPDYLEKAFLYFNNNPQYGAFGGQGLFKSDIKSEIIIQNQLIYAVGPQAENSKDITYEKGYVYGAGLCLQKQAYLKSKPNKTLLTDRKGNNLSSGGDTELCFNLVHNGYRIGYFDDLKFYHAIQEDRLNINYIRKFIISCAKETYLLDGLQYKANIHPKMFDKAYKRNWFIKLIREFISKPKFDEINNFKTILRVKSIRIFNLLKLNFTYDKSFK